MRLSLISSIVVALFCCLSVTLVHASKSRTCTVTGTVTDPTGAVIPGARVTLSAGTDFHETILTNQVGQFKFNLVPLGQFRLIVEAHGYSRGEAAGELNSAFLVHDIHFKSVTDVQHLEVKGEENASGANPSVTHHDINADDLEKLPIAPPNGAMSAVIESIPGTVPEENGRIHVRGSEVQPQYVLDGVPFSDNLSGTYATSLDVENVRSTQIVTGNIPAEFGDKIAAVVNITTKSGFDGPWRGNLSLSAGSFNSGGADAEVGGHFKNLGIFLTADASESSRFFDPPEIQNFHNRGGLVHVFSRFDLLATAKDVVRLTLSSNGSNFQVPNLLEQEQAGQRQRQQLRDDFEAVNWNHVFNATTVTDVALFRRASSARVLDPDRTGTPFFLEQDRSVLTEGARASLSAQAPWNSIKVGFESYRSPVEESLSLAVTDPAEVRADEPVLNFTLAQPFVFAERRTAVREAAYCQDHIYVGERFTADLGLRFDHYDFLVHQSATSPRVGVAYRVPRTNTVLRASYNRFFQTPPLENLLLSSSRAVALLSPVNADSFVRVPPEHQNVYEFGFEQPIGKYLRLDATHYVKNIKSFSDDQQLFATAVVFPVAIAGADIRGTEFRLDLAPWHGYTAFVSFANARATATGPLLGGLFLGHEEDALLGAGGKFAADQDERNEVQIGGTYSHRSGAWLNVTGRYDSGIPTEFDPVDLPSLDPRIQAQLDPIRLRIKPRTLLNAAAGMDLARESRLPVSLQVSVNNLTDRFYLYNFQSVFSGTHIGRPREVIGRIVFRWTAK
jgi:outer membrane receptor protein involved in Fe transport